MRGGAVLLLLAPAQGVFVKGTLHQHASQPEEKCHYAAPGINACGKGCMREQDDGGTAADTLLSAIAKSNRGYAFVGLVGNEEPATPPKNPPAGLVTLSVMENQMAAVCEKGSSKRCSKPCDPVPPAGAGPWYPVDPPINNLHREYIEGVPGYWAQHPQTDPQRDEIDALMRSGKDNLRGLEVYNGWVEQAWNAQVALKDEDIDYLYPPYRSMAMAAWDGTLRSLRRPVFGLADDDGFDYTGDSEETVYPHEHKDTVQTDTAAWFRFGLGWIMAEVDDAKTFGAADISKALDEGRFYASTGVLLDTSGRTTSVLRAKVISEGGEKVVFGAVGGSGQVGDNSTPLTPFNLTLCANPKNSSVVTNVGCGTSSGPPPPASHLEIDLSVITDPFFFVRVQAFVRRRYSIAKAPSSNTLRTSKHKNKKTFWEFELGAEESLPLSDFAEGRLVRIAGGQARRPFVVYVTNQTAKTVQVVSHFADDETGDLTPESGGDTGGTTTIANIVPGVNQLVAERWAWLQPVFRQQSPQGLVDPFAKV